jgi:hypothetical protein
MNFTVPQRVDHGVGVARGKLQYQVTAALRGVEVVVRERLHRGQVLRAGGGERVAVVEQRRADAERHLGVLREPPHGGRPGGQRTA